MTTPLSRRQFPSMTPATLPALSPVSSQSSNPPRHPMQTQFPPSNSSFSSSAAAKPSLYLDLLPPEILSQILHHLPSNDLQSLLKSRPSLKSISIMSKHFCPWRRRWDDFSSAYRIAFNELNFEEYQNTTVHKRQADGQNPSVQITQASQVHRRRQKRPKEIELEMKMQTLWECFGFPTPDIYKSSPTAGAYFPRMDDDTVFKAIENTDNITMGSMEYLRLKKLEGVDLGELKAGLEKRTTMPLEIVERVAKRKLTGGSDACTTWQIVTAYLFYTSLIPGDVEEVIKAATRREKTEFCDTGHQFILTEYFCFLRLMIALWDEQEKTKRVIQGEEPNHIFMEIQHRRILGSYLDECLRATFAMAKPMMKADSDPPTPLLTPQRIVILAERSLSEGFTQKSRRTGLDRGSLLGFSQMSLEIPKAPDTTSTLTAEQLKVVNTNVSPRELMKVRAYAGTGKTRCLVEYTKKRPDKNFLYIAYNKSLQLDAQAKFPANVTCKTVHALALSVLRHTAPIVSAAERQKNTLAPFWGNKEITETLKLDTTDAAWSAFDAYAVFKYKRKSQNNTENSSEQSTRKSRRNGGGGSSAQSTGASWKKKSPLPIYSIATAVKNTLSNFWNSGDDKIKDHHLSRKMVTKFGFKKETILQWANDIWTEIQAGTHPYLPHDAYLKLLHLNPAADDIAFQNYDIILLDEAQDSNACVSDIILRQQQRAGIIVVGDPYQRIYGFRGARNAPFNDVDYPPTITCHLTWSFRFGDNIARAANILLKAMGEEVLLNGARKDDAIYDYYSPFMQLLYNKPLDPPREHFVVIFRKNMTLVQYALAFQILHPNYKMVLKVKNNYKKETLFNNLRDGYRLFHGQRTRSTLLKDFDSWYELEVHVQSEDRDHAEQSDLELIFGLRSQFATPTFLDDLKNAEANIIDNEDEAEVTLINTHQAKGREWDNVVLANDFIDFNDRGHVKYNSYYQEEAGVLYVALTRARKKLVVGEVGNWIHAKQGGIKHFVAFEDRRCSCCQDESPQTVDQKIILGAVRVMKYYSFTTALEKLPEEPHIRSVVCLACARNRLENGEWRTWWIGKSYLTAFAKTMAEAEISIQKATTDVIWSERSPWGENWEQDYRDESERVRNWFSTSFGW